MGDIADMVKMQIRGVLQAVVGLGLQFQICSSTERPRDCALWMQRGMEIHDGVKVAAGGELEGIVFKGE